MGNTSPYSRCCGKLSTMDTVVSNELREAMVSINNASESESNQAEYGEFDHDKMNVSKKDSPVSTLENMNQDSFLQYMGGDDDDLPAVSLYISELASFDTQNVEESYKPELANDTLSQIKELSRLREIATFLIFGYCRKLNESDEPYYDIVFTISSYYDFDAEEFLEIHSHLFFQLPSVDL